MSPGDAERRPGQGRRGNQTGEVETSIAPAPAQRTHDALDTDGWDEVARVVRGAFVVVVTIVGDGGHEVQHRRRVFLTVNAAQAAAEKARARGQLAEVVLAELRPLFHVTAGGAL